MLLRREIYVTAALGGALVYVALIGLGADRLVAAGIGFVATFGIRGLALARGWSLPTYRARPGRDYPQ